MITNNFYSYSNGLNPANKQSFARNRSCVDSNEIENISYLTTDLISKDAANGIMVAKSPLVSKQNKINFDEPSEIIEPATIEQVRKEALIGLNKELEEETDPIKTKELKEMKLIIEAGEQEVTKPSKKDVNKINETTFCGRNQILASIAVIATASTTAAWTAGSMAQAPGTDEVALSAVTAGMI